MTAESEVRHGRHCVFNLHVHFVAKYRRRVFDGPAIERLREIFAAVYRDFEARLVEMDGEEDHVHLLVEYPPKVPVSGLVNSLKGVSSRFLRRDRRDIARRYWKGVLWSRATSPRPAAARQSPSCARTSSSSSDRPESGERGIEPRPPGRYPSPP